MTKILIIEDDNDINKLLSEIVKQAGYHSKSAYSGTEALIYLKEEQWDLICLDLMLPGLSGETLLEKIKSYGTTPIIVISAKDDQGVKIDELRSGADDFIVKPFDVDEVAARIDSVIRRSKGAKKIDISILKYKDIVVDIQAKYVNHKLKITCQWTK